MCTGDPPAMQGGKETTLLDICCGTGTIGIALASRVREVFGLELVADAVEDAKRNAMDNGRRVWSASRLCLPLSTCPALTGSPGVRARVVCVAQA